MNNIGKSVWKIVSTEARHPVTLAPTTSSMAVGVRIATSRKPTARPTIAGAVVPPEFYIIVISYDSIYLMWDI